MTDPRVRPMRFADCDRVSQIRVRGWRSAYRGLVPQSYLDALSVSADAERRRARFPHTADGVVNLVAERAGEIVGWAAHGPYRAGETPTDDAELYALYADAAHLGSGVGRALLQESVRQRSSHPRMLLWVLKENTRARRFYERAGFHADGAEEPFEVDGVTVPEVRYVKRLGH
ncbi:GNAT family N-acetyltransferase [Streptomyces resistomycificus]|uniref:Acetyltransferase n=1 Tax=Streptomyces resistomycificus TaxID=67356 RepID=A0A0L8LY68_9ACTN|nr:GNAT family N-acetyltransferase [Streptomyces resistomycificus]KOG43034.1 acetyltransferase [Streptomyces resistomycificus]KUO01336.1 acetyltransferase [Streptomyces resistomycificus]